MPLAIARHQVRKLCHELGPLWPRADQAHLAEQHVDQLGELVQAEAPNDLAQTRAPRVIWHRPYRPRGGLGVGPHRAELEHVKRTPVQADPLLDVQDRPVRGRELHQQRHQQQPRRQEH